MRGFFKGISVCGIFICTLIFSLVFLGEKAIPDRITVIGGDYKLPKLLSVKPFSESVNTKADTALTAEESSEGEATVNLLGVIPVKSTTIVNSKRQYVTLGGDIFGIKLFTRGVVVVDTDTVDTEAGTVNPAEKAGLKIGDIIITADGVNIEDIKQLASIIRSSKGGNISLGVLSEGKTKHIVFKTEKEAQSGQYRAGLWVRDSTAGIGTVTFYNPQNNSFGGLGHGIYDADTEEIMPMKSGEMAEAYISGFYRSTNGCVGELCGVFTGKCLGSLCINGETGIYGFTEPKGNKSTVPVALRQEVKLGKAQIYCTVDKNGPKAYDAEIIKINSNSSSVNKDMVIEITDSELLEKTGGILQGMSGTPIIQDGMLIGAVTHVFVNDTRKGYAIFAERMLETSVCQEMEKQQQILKAAS